MSERKIEAAFDEVAKKINMKDVFYQEEIGSRAVWQTAVDLIFACAPIVLLAILSIFKQDVHALSFFGLSDWSLIATFLFGQAVIKIFQVPINMSGSQVAEPTTGVAALLICIGLLPSSVIFALTFGGATKSIALLVLQMVWFIFSVVAYIFVAYISNASAILRTELARRLEFKIKEELGETVESLK